MELRGGGLGSKSSNQGPPPSPAYSSTSWNPTSHGNPGSRTPGSRKRDDDWGPITKEQVDESWRTAAQNTWQPPAYRTPSEEDSAYEERKAYKARSWNNTPIQKRGTNPPQSWDWGWKPDPSTVDWDYAKRASSQKVQSRSGGDNQNNNSWGTNDKSGSQERYDWGNTGNGNSDQQTDAWETSNDNNIEQDSGWQTGNNDTDNAQNENWNASNADNNYQADDWNSNNTNNKNDKNDDWNIGGNDDSNNQNSGWDAGNANNDNYQTDDWNAGNIANNNQSDNWDTGNSQSSGWNAFGWDNNGLSGSWDDGQSKTGSRNGGKSPGQRRSKNETSSKAPSEAATPANQSNSGASKGRVSRAPSVVTPKSALSAKSKSQHWSTQPSPRKLSDEVVEKVMPIPGSWSPPLVPKSRRESTSKKVTEVTASASKPQSHRPSSTRQTTPKLKGRQSSRKRQPTIIEEDEGVEPTHKLLELSPMPYTHRRFRPHYMDTHEDPYAVFVFHYRDMAIISKMCKKKIVETPEELRGRLSTLSKTEILEILLQKTKVASEAGSSDKLSWKTSSAYAGHKPNLSAANEKLDDWTHNNGGGDDRGTTDNSGGNWDNSNNDNDSKQKNGGDRWETTNNQGGDSWGNSDQDNVGSGGWDNSNSNAGGGNGGWEDSNKQGRNNNNNNNNDVSWGGGSGGWKSNGGGNNGGGDW